MKKNRPQISINPREPLTKKARSAIYKYVFHKLAKCPRYSAAFLVEWTLEAERMKRAKLYVWLEEHGYKWKGSLLGWDVPAWLIKQETRRPTM
jgi:hypothetical protein